MEKLSMILFAILCELTVSAYNKYDIPDMNAENPFRMGKMNMIWDKAKKRENLDRKRLAELFADLTLQDKREMELKHRQADRTDPDGLFEASVRRNMNEILRQYNLQTHFPRDSSIDGVAHKRRTAYELKDENLRDLLEKAKQEGFTAKEMETLQQEFGHHQLKLDEYQALQTEYDKKYENVDNSLENLDDQDKLWKELHFKNEVLKEKKQNIKQDFAKLQQKTSSPTFGEFEDPRVVHLWSLARQSGIGNQELESIRKELTHFEHRIRKAEFMKEELKKRGEKIQKAGDFNTEHLEQRQKDLIDRHKHYEAMVEKHHADIKTRIQKRLDEL